MGVLDVDPLLAAVGFADLILGRDHAGDLAEALDLDFLDWLTLAMTRSGSSP